MRMLMLLLVATTGSCHTTDSMTTRTSPLPRIEITTDGGITGRGFGGIAIEGDSVTATDSSRNCHGSLTPADRGALAQAMLPFGPVRNEDSHPDQIHYVLRAGEQTATWYGETAPKPAAPLFSTLWRLRQRVLGGCR